VTDHQAGRFREDQVERLLRPIRPNRVFHNQGNSNVAGWDIRAHLNRMFGFDGWDVEIVELEVIHEVPRENPAKNGRQGWTGWYVTYRAKVRLTVRDPDGRVATVKEGIATGSGQNQPHLHDAHDLAMKNADTYALKRAAMNLGDQFGLSLYNKGQTKALVGMTLVGMPDAEGPAADEPDTVVEAGDDHDPDANLARFEPAPEEPADTPTPTAGTGDAPAATEAVPSPSQQLATRCDTPAKEKAALRLGGELAVEGGTEPPGAFGDLLRDEALCAGVLARAAAASKAAA
jgi:hypothetical protein